jgi:hypothetical protein
MEIVSEVTEFEAIASLESTATGCNQKAHVQCLCQAGDG